MATQGFVCNDHNPVQHRDGKEPWCKNCGLNRKGYQPWSRFGGQGEVHEDSPARFSASTKNSHVYFQN